MEAMFGNSCIRECPLDHLIDLPAWYEQSDVRWRPPHFLEHYAANSLGHARSSGSSLIGEAGGRSGKSRRSSSSRRGGGGGEKDEAQEQEAAERNRNGRTNRNRNRNRNMNMNSSRMMKWKRG